MENCKKRKVDVTLIDYWSCDICGIKSPSDRGGPPIDFEEHIVKFGGQSGINYYLCRECFADVKRKEENTEETDFDV